MENPLNGGIGESDDGVHNHGCVVGSTPSLESNFLKVHIEEMNQLCIDFIAHIK